MESVTVCFPRDALSSIGPLPHAIPPAATPVRALDPWPHDWTDEPHAVDLVLAVRSTS